MPLSFSFVWARELRRRLPGPAVPAITRWSACSVHTQTQDDTTSQARSGPAFKYFSRRDAKFQLAAVKPEQYAHVCHPEVAFAGRSNVGKSSLIGMVLRSRSLVKTSRKPGHTSTLNFFSLTSQAYPDQLSVVDMPGYGFRSRGEWGRFIMRYLSTRKELRRVFMLVEAKVGHLKSTDQSFLELAEEYGVPTQILLTKTDKLKRADLEIIGRRVIEEAAQAAPSVVQPMAISCSSRTGAGIDAVQAEILRVCDVIPTK